MKYVMLFVCVLAGQFVIAQKKAPIEATLKGIEVPLNQILKDTKAPGFAVAVVYKKKIIYSAGFGSRDLKKSLPVTADTKFAIGSCTKAFTSGLLGQLREAGKLSFTDKPSKYIPGLEFFNDEMNSELQILDFMCHRSGLPRHDFSWYLFNTSNRDSLAMRLKFQEPSAGIREAWQYNNFGFLLQGMIAEKITGKSWEKLVEENLFKPLEMKTSSTVIAGLETGPEPAIGYDLAADKSEYIPYYNINGMAPAGSINSSVNEMAHWVITWINGGKYKDTQVLPATYVAEALGPRMVINPSGVGKEHPDVHLSTYGLGWMQTSYRGHYRVEHGGNIDGFSASTAFFPTDSIGIIVLTNQNGSRVPSLVRNTIADRVLGLAPFDWNKESNDLVAKSKKAEAEAAKTTASGQIKGTKTSRPLIAFTGTYSNEGYGSIKAYLKNDSLFMASPTIKLWLKHYHYDIFRPARVIGNRIDSTETSAIKLNFRTNDNGELAGFEVAGFEPSVKPLFFKFTPAAAPLDAAALAKYVGEYELAGTVCKIYLKGSIVFLFVPNQPEYELVYLGSDKFTIKSLEGFNLKFTTESAGLFQKVTFIQPNGTFEASRKK